MKVRIGVGATGGLAHPGELAALVDGLDRLRFDSLWLPEILTGPVPDPLVALAWAAAHNRHLKLGTTMLLPGRNPLRLAKALAALDSLSEGRLLLTFVPGLAQDPERSAVGVPPDARGAAMDEVLPLLRRLWSGETVTHDGPVGRLRDVTLSPLPHQEPLEMWLGGMAPAALRRCGRLADGWLPSLCTPEQAADGRRVIDAEAAAAGRAISDEHFGVSIGYARAPLSERAAATVAARSRGADPRRLVPVGGEALRRLIEEYIDAGFSKFVVRPLSPPADWETELTDLAAAVGDLQT